MYIFLMIVHILVCLFLIAVILLQAGRGGGLSEMAGGSNQAQSILGTQTNVFMTRLTEVCAVIFIVTSLSLAIISTQRGKSLIDKALALPSAKQTLPAAAKPQTAPASNITSPAPAETVNASAAGEVKPEAASPAPSEGDAGR
jgi:preprotein translocase subunit SecG